MRRFAKDKSEVVMIGYGLQSGSQRKNPQDIIRAPHKMTGYLYTPEMMVYYLEHPGIQNLISTKYNYKLGSVSSKNRILHDLIPGLVPKQKTHGYENLGAFNIETYFELYKTHTNRLESSLDGIKMVDLVRMLGVEENANIKTRYNTQ